MKKIIIIAALAALSWGCKGFLEDKSYSQLSGDDFFNTQENTEYMVNGCYQSLKAVPGNFLIMNETSTDNVCIVPGRTHKTQTNWVTGIFNPSDSWPDATWGNLYSVIFNCNYLLDNIKPSIMQEAFANRYMAEARFLRGWAYLMLTNAFGDVPLRTTSVYGKAQYDCHLTKQSDIYDFLLSDLEYAEQNLFDFSYDNKAADSKGEYAANERFRVSVTSALGMEALAYMYRAGSDPANAGGEAREDGGWWAHARDKAKECIDRCGGLTDPGTLSDWLSPAYGDLWHTDDQLGNMLSTTGKWHKESLFAVYADRVTGQGTNMGNNWCVWASYTKDTYNGYCRYINNWYTKHFAGHYDARNAQMLHHVFQQVKTDATGTTTTTNYLWPSNQGNFNIEVGYDWPNGGTGYTKWSANPAGPFIKKYDDVLAPASGTCDATLHFLRFAEVLLIYAEAENEVNGGPDDDAYKALNMVRTRANVRERMKDPADKTGQTYVFGNLILAPGSPGDVTISYVTEPEIDPETGEVVVDPVTGTAKQVQKEVRTPVPAMDQAQFRDYVLDERDRELFLEGKRLFDLNRRGLYAKYVSATQGLPEFTAAQTKSKDMVRTRGQARLILAIPQSERDTNHEL